MSKGSESVYVKNVAMDVHNQWSTRIVPICRYISVSILINLIPILTIIRDIFAIGVFFIATYVLNSILSVSCPKLSRYNFSRSSVVLVTDKWTRQDFPSIFIRVNRYSLDFKLCLLLDTRLLQLKPFGNITK